MTNDRHDAEAARLARVKRITSVSKGKVITAAELLRRHRLPDSIEEIEAGVKGPKSQGEFSPVFGFADRRLNPVAIMTIGFPSIMLGPSYITRPCGRTGRVRRIAMLQTPHQFVATPSGCW